MTVSTARTDLDHAFSILDAGITAHVAALKTSKVSEAAAKAAQADESYITAMTTKVLALADTLSASNPVALATPVAVVLTPEVAQAAQVAQVLPVAAPLPASVLHDPGATPAMIAAAIAAAKAEAPDAPAAPLAHSTTTFAQIEAALQSLVSKK